MKRLESLLRIIFLKIQPNKRDKQLIDTNFKDNHTTIFNKKYTELQNAILKASSGIYPEKIIFTHDKKNDNSNQDGLVLLNAIFKISNSSNFNITDVQTGLASLVKLGLVNDFKNISNELLIREYFKKNLGI